MRKSIDMKKISFLEFNKMMSYDVQGTNTCIEIRFQIDKDKKYDLCWMGKFFDNVNKKEIYWYGLVEDGTESYSFESEMEFVMAPIYKGENIKNIWNYITIISIDGCDVDERLLYYLK